MQLLHPTVYLLLQENLYAESSSLISCISDAGSYIPSIVGQMVPHCTMTSLWFMFYYHCQIQEILEEIGTVLAVLSRCLSAGAEKVCF